MPVITYEGTQLSQNQREVLIKGFTDVACKVMPEIPKEAFYVYIREYPDEKIGIGGLPLPDYLAELRKR